MDLNEYQDKALRTAITNGVGPEKEDLPRFVLGLVGEAGEVAEKLKKQKRGDYDIYEARDRIADELGDMMWYAVIVCYCLGVSPNKVLENNVAKLADRHERGRIKGDGDDR